MKSLGSLAVLQEAIGRQGLPRRWSWLVGDQELATLRLLVVAPARYFDF